MMHSNKYDIRRNEVHETLNKPIHRFISLGNALIGVILIVFVALFNGIKIRQHVDQTCLLKFTNDAVGGGYVQVTLLMPEPSPSVSIRAHRYFLITNGYSTDIKVDSVTDAGQAIHGRLRTAFLKNVTASANRNDSIFCTFRKESQPVTFFQIFYKKLFHF